MNVMNKECAHEALDFADRETVTAVQEAKLAKLGERLARSEPWKAHFAAAGAGPLDMRDRKSLAAMPTLSKARLRELYPYPFLTADMKDVTRFCATSGTTGLPVLFGFTRHDWDVTMVRQLTRIFRTVGLTPEDRVYQGYGYGLWIGGPSMDEALKNYGATNFPVGPGRGELMASWMKDHRYTATTMSPLWLATLIGYARKAGIDPKKDWSLRIGMFGGQSVSSTFREELEAQMPEGFLAHNIYGTTEAGGPILAISCPHSHKADEMHLINDDTVLTEILNPDTLEPVQPGEIGEIVVTTLDKQASPVVRWRTHDLVRLSKKPYDCPCGRHGYPLIGRIVGRSDDMLKVRGVIVYPSQVEDVVAGIDGTMKEAWQIYVDSQEKELGGLEVAIERRADSPATTADLARRVREQLRARLGLTCVVVCHEEGTLPRYEAKATRVLIRKPSA